MHQIQICNWLTRRHRNEYTILIYIKYTIPNIAWKLLLIKYFSGYFTEYCNLLHVITCDRSMHFYNKRIFSVIHYSASLVITTSRIFEALKWVTADKHECIAYSMLVWKMSVKFCLRWKGKLKDSLYFHTGCFSCLDKATRLAGHVVWM